MKLLLNYFDRCLNFLMKTACLVLLTLVFIVNIDVIMRYFFNNPLNITLPFSELGIVLIASLGWVWLQREGGHVRIDIIFEKLNPIQKCFFNCLTSFLSAIVISIIAFYSIPLIQYFVKVGVVFYDTSSLIPGYFYLLPLTLCYILLFIQYIRSFFDYLTCLITKKYN